MHQNANKEEDASNPEAIGMAFISVMVVATDNIFGADNATKVTEVMHPEKHIPTSYSGVAIDPLNSMEYDKTTKKGLNITEESIF